MLKPWRDKPLPETENLIELQRSVEYLIDEEINAEKGNLAFKKWS